MISTHAVFGKDKLETCSKALAFRCSPIQLRSPSAPVSTNTGSSMGYCTCTCTGSGKSLDRSILVLGNLSAGYRPTPSSCWGTLTTALRPMSRSTRSGSTTTGRGRRDCLRRARRRLGRRPQRRARTAPTTTLLRSRVLQRQKTRLPRQVIVRRTAGSMALVQ